MLPHERTGWIWGAHSRLQRVDGESNVCEINVTHEETQKREKKDDIELEKIAACSSYLLSARELIVEL